MVMRYHWGLGVGHLYSHGPREDSTATATGPDLELGNLDDADEPGLDVVNARHSEPGPSHRALQIITSQSKSQSESPHGKDNQAGPDPDPSPGPELQLDQVLAEGYAGLDTDLESDLDSDGWNSDLDSDSGSDSEESIGQELDNLEDDTELFDMFGDTAAVEFTSYD
jgi:hypothetical protein